jgi:hypothetical protein
MRVITDNPILEDHSNALGDKFRERRARKGKTTGGIKKSKGDGFFSKEKRSERKTGRQDRREERDGFFSATNRAKRKANREKRKSARKGATPLETTMGPGGTKVYLDPLPPVTQNTDGSFTKVLPGNMDFPEKIVVDVPPGDITKVPTPGPGPDILVDAKDLNAEPTKPPIIAKDPLTGAPAIKKEYVEEEIDIVEDETTGQQQVFKKADVEPGTGMSKGLKVGLIVGGVVVAGVISYVIYKSMKAKNS